MKTGRLFTILCAGIFLFSCAPEKNTFSVEGFVPEGYEDFTVYLIDPDTNLAIDSTQVNENKFSFTGEQDTTVYRRVRINDKLYSIFIPEAGDIHLDLSDPYLMSGTALNDKLADFLKEKKQASDVRENQKLIIDSYFSENHTNAIGKLIFEDSYRNFSSEEFESKYQLLSETIQNSDRIQSIYKKAIAKKQTSEGMMFTDFTIHNANPDGASASLSDYVGKGKYVLVDFWASWCGPCIREIPVIMEVYNKYQGDKFEVLGVAVWEKSIEDSKKAIEQHAMPWPQILNAASIPTELYGIEGIPHIILFGPDGTILARGLRGEYLKGKVAEVMQ